MALLPELPESCFSFGAVFLSLRARWCGCTAHSHSIYKMPGLCEMHETGHLFFLSFRH